MSTTRPWAIWLAAVLCSFGIMEYHGFARGIRWPTLSFALAVWVRPAPRSIAGAFVLFWFGLAVHVLRRVK